MIKHLAVIALAVTVSSPAISAESANPYSIFLNDAWGTILGLDKAKGDKWHQDVIIIDNVMTSTISTIWRAGCVDDPAICLQIERKYPSGDTVVEFIPFDI